jgi:hypothetical protein
MPHLLAYSARNPAFGRAWRARVLDPPREQLRRVLLRAITRRELPADLDVDTAIVLLHGPLMYAHMLTLMQRTPPDRLPDAVVDTFLRAYARPTSKHAARRDAARLSVDPSA